MNYFPFDPSPRLSAIALDDKRLARVFSEAVMTLSSAQHALTGVVGPYSSKVPIPRYLIDLLAGDTGPWFKAWTFEMLNALIERNGADRVFAYSTYQKYSKLDQSFRLLTDPLPLPTVFPNFARAVAKGLDYTSWDDTHAAYREYIRVQWNGIDKRPCVWTHHGPPAWRDGG